MAVEPLFVYDYTALTPSIELLYSKNRMVYSKVTDESKGVIDRMIQQVRVKLYGYLTSDLVTEILLTDAVENPSTDDELRRARAELLETLWVQYLILPEFPFLVFDASGSDPMEIWNREPLTRDIDPDLLESRLRSLKKQINDLIEELISSIPSSGVRAIVFGPEDDSVAANWRQGETIVPGGTDILGRYTRVRPGEDVF